MRAALATFLILVAVVAFPVEANAQSSQRAQIVAHVDAWIAERHFRPRNFPRKRIVDEAVQRLQAGEDYDSVTAWLERELDAEQFRFAKIGAAHDPDARYRLPFPLRIPVFMSQGYGGSTHKGYQYFSFDFVLAMGTPILAARAGRVARVVDGFVGSAGNAKYDYRVNIVCVLHEDGSFAVYTHLRKGVVAKEGQHVRRGQLLGHSGNTGWSTAPHLHFSVQRLTARGAPESLSIRLGAGGGFVPKQGHFYGSPGHGDVRLRVSVDGAPVIPGKIIPLANGASASLRVEVLDGPDGPRDVTADPATSYGSITLWSLTVSQSGVATATPMPGYEEVPAPEGAASMVVLYGNPARPPFGMHEVHFQLIESSEPDATRRHL